MNKLTHTIIYFRLALKGMISIKSKRDLASIIDHTLLEPSSDKNAIDRLCDEALAFSFYSVTVNPYYVPYCRNRLKGSNVKVVSVVGFPFGATFKEVKSQEAKRAIEMGADEVDMVMNIGAAKSGDWDIVEEDIGSVVDVSKHNGKVVKVILETCYLTDEEKIMACKVAEKAGADYVKTSTGYGKGGATVHDVKLMSNTVGSNMGVKAAGGIRTAYDALMMIEAGATRIGSSHSVEIIQSLAKELLEKEQNLVK